MKNEKKFYEALENIFVGAQIEGEGGYVNLLKIKEKYYSRVLNEFKKEINNDVVITDTFKDKFFELLFNFFEKYFSECGSVYFTKTANWQNVYEKVYTDNKDVVLFWKTHMLYYIKSDILFQSVYVKSTDVNENSTYVFFFDVGKLQLKQNNEKKELLFTTKEVKVGRISGLHDDSSGDKTFVLSVGYSEKGKKTDINSLSSQINVPSLVVENAIKAFKKQTTVDFFINKNAKLFLEEQLDFFLHKYLLEKESEFNVESLNQIKTVKKYALKLISFISQFENELVRIWNKPKFVRNSNYVISFKTLKNILDASEYNIIRDLYWSILCSNSQCKNDVYEIIKETYKRPLQNLYVENFSLNNYNVIFQYVKFYKNNDKGKKNAIEICGMENLEKFKGEIIDKGEVLDGYLIKYEANHNYKTVLPIDELYLDTKFLSKEDKGKLIFLITNHVNLDEVLDGYIVKSDNYQFLQSANKFNNKIDIVYIDPPFNTNTEGFAFIDGFKDSSWLTQMMDRYELLYNKFMSDNSSLYVHGDHHCNYYMRLLLDDIAGQENFNREIIWNTSPAISGLKAGPLVKNYIRQHDTILYYCKGKPTFNKLYREYKNEPDKLKKLGWLDLYCDDKKTPYFYKYDDKGNIIKIECSELSVMALGDVWNDVYSMMYSQNMTRENWGKSNTQKPENLVRRCIQASSNINDFVMDIYIGSGTTIAAAHKLGRKWIGVDSGDFIDDIVIKRMKSVVMGDIMPKLSEDLNWQGGGFFKYYQLEQYEDVLNNVKYCEKGELHSEDVFSQYVFFSDEKLLDIVEIKDKNINLNFDRLYKDIDFPETISLLYGKRIEKVTSDYVKLEGINLPIKYNINLMSNEEKIAFIKMIKPLLWWGE